MDYSQDAQSHTLQELSDELTFFTPGPLVRVFGLDWDPVGPYIQETEPDEDAIPFAIDCQWPLFDGLGVTAVGGQLLHWNHRLYAVPTPHWDPLLEFVQTMAFVSRGRKLFGRALPHLLLLADPTSIHTRPAQDELPLLRVTVFAASTNAGRYYIRESPSPPQQLPYLTRDEPLREICQEAAYVLGEGS